MAINSEQLNSLFYSVLLFETPRRDENKSCTLMKRPVLLHRMAIFKEDFSLSLSLSRSMWPMIYLMVLLVLWGLQVKPFHRRQSRTVATLRSWLLRTSSTSIMFPLWIYFKKKFGLQLHLIVIPSVLGVSPPDTTSLWCFLLEIHTLFLELVSLQCAKKQLILCFLFTAFWDRF